MKVIILAGGGGSRLFPLSRKSYPKQFLKLEDERSLLVHTVERFLDFVAPEDVLVVTNERYLYHVQSELAECHAEGAHVILEPVARNTAPAIALALRFCEERLRWGRAAGGGGGSCDPAAGCVHVVHRAGGCGGAGGGRVSRDVRHPGAVAGDGVWLYRGGGFGWPFVRCQVVPGEAGS